MSNIIELSSGKRMNTEKCVCPACGLPGNLVMLFPGGIGSFGVIHMGRNPCRLIIKHFQALKELPQYADFGLSD